MKASQEILQLPVLSIREGKQIGVLKRLVLNPEEGKVDYLLLEDGAWYLRFKVIPFEAVQGIGEFALTVADRNSISYISEDPKLLDLLEKNIYLPGLKVLSNKGRFLGTINEYYVSESTGEITGCQITPVDGDSPAGIIQKNAILTFGREFLVVEEMAEESLVTNNKDLSAEPPDTGKAFAPPEKPDEVSKLDANLPGPPALAEEKQEEKQMVDEFKQFEELQRQFLLGKKLTMQIVADTGEVVAEEGETITEEIIERAKVADKFIQLTLNVQE